VVKIGVVIHTKLLHGIWDQASIDKLNSLGEVAWTDSEDPISEEQAIAILKDADIGIGSWRTPGPREAVVQACPKLRLWVHSAGTVKGFFGPHLKGRDLKIASCAPAIATGVAEFAVGQLIVGLRRVIPNARANRDGRPPKPADNVNITEATIGIIGASHVGREVMRMLKPFACRQLVYDPFFSPEEAAALGVEKADELLELCAESHAVSLHTPALETTRKMMGATQFKAMRDDAVFVNTSRGMCVDEAALVAELEKGRLFAFLDVTDPEPAAPDSPLRRLPNCYLTSHIAGGPSHPIGRQAVADVEAFLAGGTPRMVVSEDMLARTA
jgi:phosphoglycerate dehydrogenase-like enzyme